MAEKEHRQLKVWQGGMDLAGQVHRITSSFPREELYGLVSQMRRSAVSSVPSNIAEGYGRGGKEYACFVSIAYGSLLELETQAELALRFGYAEEPALSMLMNICSEVGKMFNGLRASLARARPGPRTLPLDPDHG